MRGQGGVWGEPGVWGDKETRGQGRVGRKLTTN